MATKAQPKELNTNTSVVELTAEDTTEQEPSLASKILSKKTVLAIGNVYLKTWYAGLGAAIVLEKKGANLIGQLIETGEHFEHNAREHAIESVDKTMSGVKASAEDVKIKANTKLHDLGLELDENINKTLHKLKVPTSNDIEDLSKLVGEVSASVASLASEIRSKPDKSGKAA